LNFNHLIRLVIIRPLLFNQILTTDLHNIIELPSAVFYFYIFTIDMNSKSKNIVIL